MLKQVSWQVIRNKVADYFVGRGDQPASVTPQSFRAALDNLADNIQLIQCAHNPFYTFLLQSMPHYQSKLVYPS